MAQVVRCLPTGPSTPLGKTAVLTAGANAVALRATLPEDPMPPHSQASLLTLSAQDAGTKGLPAQLPLGAAEGVRVILEGSDFAAVEAAVAAMKVRFSSRFAVTGRQLGADRQVLRISASLIATPDIGRHATGARPPALPASSDAAFGTSCQNGAR